MIFNAATQGGIRKEDINAELLQSLDPDFKADNIAEGVDLFGLVGTHAGAKIATGTVSASGKTLSVTGLSFTPTQVYLIRSTATSSSSAYQYAIGQNCYYPISSNSPKVAVFSCNNGFSYDCSAYALNFMGTYYWVAWAN